MASNHIQRVNEDIRLCLSELLRQVKDPRVRQGDLLSVVRVDTAGDLSQCRVYISVLGQVDEKEFKRGLRSSSGWLRRELGASLSLRHTPELLFELDRSIEHGAHINRLIRELELPGQEEGAEGE